MDISFYCYKCGQHIVIDEAGAGVQIECPGCRIALTVPQVNSQPVKPPVLPVAVPPVVSKSVRAAPVQMRRMWKTPIAVIAFVCIGILLLLVAVGRFSGSSSTSESPTKITHQEAYDLGYKAGITDAVYPADALTHSDAEKESLARKVASGIYHVEDSQVDQWVDSFMSGYRKALGEFNNPSSRSHVLGMKAGMEMCQQGAVKPSDEVLDAMARQAVGTGGGNSYMWKMGFQQGWSAAHGL